MEKADDPPASNHGPKKLQGHDGNEADKDDTGDHADHSLPKVLGTHDFSYTDQTNCLLLFLPMGHINTTRLYTLTQTITLGNLCHGKRFCGTSSKPLTHQLAYYIVESWVIVKATKPSK